MQFIMIYPFKYFLCCFFYNLPVIMPMINLATLHWLIHLFKFKFAQTLKWSIIWMELGKYTFFIFLFFFILCTFFLLLLFFNL